MEVNNEKKEDLETSADITDFDYIDPKQQAVIAGAQVPVLICMKGKWFREPFILRETGYTIGRVSRCDIHLDARNVSRIHAHLSVKPPLNPGDPPTVAIHDADSRNGTFVNQEEVKGPTDLHEGDTIMIGEYVFGLFFRSEMELAMEINLSNTLARHGQTVAMGRIPSNLSVTLSIVMPEETFTPKDLNGIAKDLSVGGLRFVTKDIAKDYFTKLLAREKYLRCRIGFPAASQELKLSGRIAWMHFDSHHKPETCALGVEFTQMTPERQQFLADQIAEVEAKEA